MKKILILIILSFLLALSVNAQNKDVGDSCLNNYECQSDVCQGGYCQAADIISLFPVAECGNNQIDELEVCDGTNLDGNDCTTAGTYIGGTLACLSDCSGFNISGCTTPTGDSGSSSSSGGSYTGGTGDIPYRPAGAACYETWECTEWSPCIDGKKIRTCEDIYNCGTEFFKKANEMLCVIGAKPTCSDGLQNQDEQGIDCGGSCETCKTCDDGILNCHEGICEDGVDCGGSCMPCSWWGVAKKPLFWVIVGTGILTVIILILGAWYWSLEKGAEEVGEQVNKFSRHPPKQFRL